MVGMNKELKVLIVEDGQYYIYGKALKDAFIKAGYKYTKLFSLNIDNSKSDQLYKRVQNKLAFGPMIFEINRQLIRACELDKPDLIFLYRCRIVFPSAVKIIKAKGTVVFSYNNDNPFSAFYPKYFWRHYQNSIKFDDMTFVYRKSNIDACLQRGAKQVEMLRSYYIGNKNYPLDIVDKYHAKYEVVFLGHYENDGRIDCLSALTSAGISVGIPRTSWSGFDEQNEYLVRLDNTALDYNLILNESKIALVFLSSWNKDTYTRRCFEIPATKTFMLSQYTEDLASMFEPDKEAVYFKTPDELVKKTKYYLAHEEERESIAKAGYERLMHDGHEVGDRVQQIIDKYVEVTTRETSYEKSTIN